MADWGWCWIVPGPGHAGQVRPGLAGYQDLSTQRKIYKLMNLSKTYHQIRTIFVFLKYMLYKQEIFVHCSRDPELTILVLTGTSMWIAEPELRTVGTRQEETSRDEQRLRVARVTQQASDARMLRS